MVRPKRPSCRRARTMTPNDTRLIEVAFPVKEVSLDSVHEKNVRHGHISTLHIWPARRPLAACRAALIAALLPDPGDPEKRRQILERMAGRVIEKIERRKVGERTVEKVKEETVGGILHWGRENGADLDWFRQEIRKAYGGRAPKVLDPFAGGGAIPLEAMRLAARRRRWTSTRSLGSSSSARWTTRRSLPDRHGRCPRSRFMTVDSWKRSSRRGTSRVRGCARCWSGSVTATEARSSSTRCPTTTRRSRPTLPGMCGLGVAGCSPGQERTSLPSTPPMPSSRP